SMLVFFGAFFPLIGAFLSGLVAVAVAFVNGGVVDGLIVLAIVVGVQQLEGDVVMPLVFGRAMQLHPLVVLLAIAAGGVAFGIVGAFLAVPAAAVIVAVDEALAEEANNSFVSVARNIRHGEEGRTSPPGRVRIDPPAPLYSAAPRADTTVSKQTTPGAMAARRETDSEAIRRYLDGIGRYSLLTAEDEVRLAKAMEAGRE